MKILKFDNARVVKFLTKHQDELEKLFWPELVFLSASFWANAIRKVARQEIDQDPERFKGNIKETYELSRRVQKEVEEVHNSMIAHMAIEHLHGNENETIQKK